ncbi:MAG: hypothetical protein LUE31_10185 [Lachnospiraceae bacterium]|nr:hypothetical protein [Lachnospiraceae bacterium]
MGGFHCPVGAVGYQSYGCIECGMCFAATKDEVNRATDIIRAYIKANAAGKPTALKKIALCGKGGSGKSTVTAMMAYALRDLGFTPIVIDTDDSNAGLHRKLGIQNTPKPLIRCLTRFAIGEDTTDNAWLEKDPLYLNEIPEDFVKENGGIYFLMSGKIENPLQGCSCSISDITKQLVSNLELGEKEVLLVDHDAGIESFGRGIEQGMDTVVIIVEPSFESVGLAETIQFMSQGIGIARIRTLINKIVDDEQDDDVKDMLIERGVKFLGSLPVDTALMKSNLRGQSVVTSPLQPQVKKIVMMMLDEAEIKYPAPERR